MQPVPTVSVLLPARNAETTLLPALRSVQRQSFADFECIVVDDGSTDGSLAIAQGVAAHDARFRSVSLPHRGLVSALNSGIELCRGRLIARMDADDLSHHARLRRQVSALDADASLDAVGGRVRLFPKRDLAAGMVEYQRWLDSIETPADVAREAFVECPLAHPTIVFRRELLSGKPYREAPWPEDYDLVLRLLADGKRLAVVKGALLMWRDGVSRLTRTAPNCARARIVECKAFYLAQGFLRDTDEYVLWGYGGTGKALAGALLALGKRPQLIVDIHPGRVGQRIGGAQVVRPETLTLSARLPALLSVAGIGPRRDARRAAAAVGLREGRDYLCVA